MTRTAILLSMVIALMTIFTISNETFGQENRRECCVERCEDCLVHQDKVTILKFTVVTYNNRQVLAVAITMQKEGLCALGRVCQWIYFPNWIDINMLDLKIGDVVNITYHTDANNLKVLDKVDKVVPLGKKGWCLFPRWKKI